MMVMDSNSRLLIKAFTAWAVAMPGWSADAFAQRDFPTRAVRRSNPSHTKDWRNFSLPETLLESRRFTLNSSA